MHSEVGCLEYGPAIDIASGHAIQEPVRENVVVIIEKWQSMETLRMHFAAPHMAEYRKRVKDFVASVHLQVLQPA